MQNLVAQLTFLLYATRAFICRYQWFLDSFGWIDLVAGLEPEIVTGLVIQRDNTVVALWVRNILALDGYAAFFFLALAIVHESINALV